MVEDSASPPDAVGFDYDGATFTHVDDLTTFEVLAASFGFRENAALGRIGGIVHALDIGGPAVPEAAGFEAVLAGTRDRARDDGELLSKMIGVLDALYDAFANDVRRHVDFPRCTHPLSWRCWQSPRARLTAHAGAKTPLPLPLHIIVDVPLDGQSRRFASQALDAKTGMLFVADFFGGRMVVFDTKTNRVVNVVRDLPSAQAILVVPEQHRVYVAEPGAYEVAVVDATTYAVVARLPGGRYPAGMAWDPVRQKLYISDVIGETETVIDTRRNARIAMIPLGGEVGNSRFARSENLVYVNVKTHNELVAIDPALDTVVADTRSPDAKTTSACSSTTQTGWPTSRAAETHGW